MFTFSNWWIEIDISNLSQTKTKQPKSSKTKIYILKVEGSNEIILILFLFTIISKNHDMVIYRVLKSETSIRSTFDRFNINEPRK